MVSRRLIVRASRLALVAVVAVSAAAFLLLLLAGDDSSQQEFPWEKLDHQSYNSTGVKLLNTTNGRKSRGNATSGESVRRLPVTPPSDFPRRPPLQNIVLLCFMMVTDYDVKYSARYSRDTWMRDCDVALFFGEKSDSSFPVIGLLPGSDKTKKTSVPYEALVKFAWTYIFQKYFHSADFFVKVQSSTYLHPDNLRAYLTRADPTVSEYYGNVTSPHSEVTRGLDVVLTREAVHQLVTKAFVQHITCNPERVVVESLPRHCLTRSGARARGMKDADGSDTFVVLPPMADKLGLRRYLTHSGPGHASRRPVAMTPVWSGDAIHAIHFLFHSSVVSLVGLPATSQLGFYTKGEYGPKYDKK